MMVPTSRSETTPKRGASDRPFAFFVSTTRCARGISNTLGSPAYSYYFAFEALIPVLEKFGTWKLLDHPESSLPFVAAKAEAQGYRPVHLSFHPPQDVYLTPAVPTIIYPFWEFPDIPDREFGHDTRQNWVRICKRADMIISACNFTKDAFLKAGVDCPISIVPVPLRPGYFQVPSWDPGHTWTHTCRHLSWGGGPPRPVQLAPATEPEHVAIHEPEPEPEPEPVPIYEPEPEPIAIHEHEPEPVAIHDPEPESATEEAVVQAPEVEPTPPAPRPKVGLKRRGYQLARKAFRKVHPWLGEKTLSRISKTRNYVLTSAGRDPQTLEPIPGGRPGLTRLGYAMARDGYRLYFKRWLSPEALEAITQTKEVALKIVGHEPVLAPDPLLPAHPLTLGGIVFTSIFNMGDRRKNHQDMLSAYLLAFKDRDDVTMVIKLATNPVREHLEVQIFVHLYHSLGIHHKCRLVLLTDFLTDEQMANLIRSTTFYVNTSRAEGACLPLQQSMAAGRPAIAPDHTSMADFMDDQVGFVLRTNPEPTHWPHDPEAKYETYWNRLVWSDLRDHMVAAAEMVDDDPARYRRMSAAARARMAGYASREISEEAFRETLARLPEVEPGRFAWAS